MTQEPFNASSVAGSNSTGYPEEDQESGLFVLVMLLILVVPTFALCLCVRTFYAKWSHRLRTKVTSRKQSTESSSSDEASSEAYETNATPQLDTRNTITLGDTSPEETADTPRSAATPSARSRQTYSPSISSILSDLSLMNEQPQIADIIEDKKTTTPGEYLVSLIFDTKREPESRPESFQITIS
mmetsp:Transcript_10382/g.11920  ORF Transcript_10382/g.11920 Transcript_10382/m.11920 type:complete len:185 (-) Transcript_10382:322-876(-)|eukprot:CAMPEP_0184023584 /NCGR_PEP_ID=MMETSP0954-20121128/11467_1 /TAXON_ID=627963 /ORGANISM="Aplanochytrium sp, Strain PBS07" /LENGTH=184 /DNA_ID=CAMNT_0026306535 /DNA_START=385 /DNA_END=939 /DNA_ORIENTATION=-